MLIAMPAKAAARLYGSAQKFLNGNLCVGHQTVPDTTLGE
jgi:hypothetical protein